MFPEIKYFHTKLSLSIEDSETVYVVAKFHFEAETIAKSLFRFERWERADFDDYRIDYTARSINRLPRFEELLNKSKCPNYKPKSSWTRYKRKLGKKGADLELFKVTIELKAANYEDVCIVGIKDSDVKHYAKHYINSRNPFELDKWDYVRNIYSYDITVIQSYDTREEVPSHLEWINEELLPHPDAVFESFAEYLLRVRYSAKEALRFYQQRATEMGIELNWYAKKELELDGPVLFQQVEPFKEWIKKVA